MYESRDRKRKRGADFKKTETGKKMRKSLRAKKKGHLDKEKVKEGGDSYAKGAFDL